MDFGIITIIYTVVYMLVCIAVKAFPPVKPFCSFTLVCFMSYTARGQSWISYMHVACHRNLKSFNLVNPVHVDFVIVLILSLLRSCFQAMHEHIFMPPQ